MGGSRTAGRGGCKWTLCARPLPREKKKILLCIWRKARGKPLARRSLRLVLRRDEGKELLRFSTDGSVDDGKSTLIGRLLSIQGRL